MGLQEQASQAVQLAFYRTFHRWGHFVARKPKCVILTSLIVSVLLSTRLLMSFSGKEQFELPSELEQDKLWVPQKAAAVDAKGRYDAAFKTTSRRNVVYATTKPPGGNILTAAVLAEVRRFDSTVNSLVNATTHIDRKVRTPLADAAGNPQVAFDDVCTQSATAFGGNDTNAPNCVIFGHPLELFYRVPGEFDFSFTDAQIAAIVTSGRGIDKQLYPDSSNRTFNVAASFGGLTYDANGAVTGAKAVQLTYMLDEKPVDSPPRMAAIAWEDQLNYLIGPQWTDSPPISEGSATSGDVVWASSLIELYPSTAGATSRELSKNIRGDLIGLQIGFMIILVYAVFIFSKCQPVKSRGGLAVSGCIAVGLSVGVAYGLPTAIGLKVNPVIAVLPFILIGIGVDDMFVLFSCLEAQPADLDVPTRMAKAMGQAGVSITITSLTDLFAFLLGAASQLPALSTFCIFAAIGIAADFLLQISFFAGFMALDAYREKRQAVDCCPCCCAPGEANVTKSCCCLCCAPIAKDGAFSKMPSCCNVPCLRMLGTLTFEGLKSFIKKYYVPFLRHKVTKVVVILGFFGYCGFSVAMATKLKQDFKFRWFVNDDAALQATFDIQDAFFSSTGLPVWVVTPTSGTAANAVDYSSIASQKKLVALGAAVAANAYIEVDSVSNWYDFLRSWYHDCGTSVSFDAPHPLAGAPCVRRDCAIGPVKVYPYCSHKKELRDAAGVTLKDGAGLDIPGASGDDKYMVDEDGNTLPDGSPLEASYIPPSKFYEYLDQFVADAPLGSIVSSNVAWQSTAAVRGATELAQGIKATRLRANYKALDKANEQVDSMKTLRASVDSAGLGSSFPYMFMYLYYEQYAIIMTEAVTNLGLALVAVFIITLLIVANLRASCLIMACVIMVDIDILGLMYLWDLSIDSVAIINLVLAIGLAVDYSAHVAHAFVQTPGTRQQRADHAVEEMGTAVIHGAVSTFLAVVILSTSKSYIFRIFFKQFFGICIFGGLHGLMFLPIMLSLVGPEYVDIGMHDAGKKPGSTTSVSPSKGVEVTESA